MASLITRVRQLINDTAGASQQFSDQEIQDVLDYSRQDISNMPLTAYPTYSGSTILYLDFYSDSAPWEDGFTLKQYLTVTVTPSSSEPIVGHFVFATTTLPPVYITGNLHDPYRASADLLERLSARWAMSYNVSVDGQSLQRGQAFTALQALAKSYRMKQRAHVIGFSRSDISDASQNDPLGAQAIDYMSSGNVGG
jgi:hypothetical protein